MRKIVVIGISILSVFILCSLSYQPIIADTPIEQIVQLEKSKASNLDVDELKELYNSLIELKSQSDDDCGCEGTTEWDYSIFCEILLLTVQALDRITDRLKEQNMENTLLYLFSITLFLILLIPLFGICIHIPPPPLFLLSIQM